MTVSLQKAAKPIVMPFGMLMCAQKNHALEGSGSPYKAEVLNGKSGVPL